MISSLASSANAALGLAGPILTPLMVFGGSFLNNKYTNTLQEVH